MLGQRFNMKSLMDLLITILVHAIVVHEQGSLIHALLVDHGELFLEVLSQVLYLVLIRVN